MVNVQPQLNEPNLLTLAEAEEQRQHMNICAIVVRPLDLGHCVHHLGFERSIESSLLPAKVTLDDGDSLGRKVQNPNPIDGVFF